MKQLNVLSEEQSTERIRRSDEFPSSYYDEEENLQNKIGSLIVVLPIAHKGKILQQFHLPFDLFHFISYSGGEVVLKFRRENIKLELDKKFAPVVSRSLMHCLNPPETEEDGYYELKYRKAVTMHQNPEVVKARLREHRIRYENHIRCGLAVPRIAFLAYYNEVEEEVEAVEFGVRVSLLYHIFSEGNEEQHKARDFEIQKAEDSLRRGIEEEDEIARRHLVALVVNKDNNQEEKPQHAQRIVSPPLNVVALMKVNSFRVKLLGLLQDSKFMAEGGYLGFPCFHLYEQESDLPSNALLAKKDLMGSDLKLRGADALIAIVGAQAGFKIIFWR